MEHMEIRTRNDLKCWVRMQLVKQETTQRALAHRMDIPETRISEAVSGKPSGKKYLIPMIEMLGGKAEDFKAIM